MRDSQRTRAQSAHDATRVAIATTSYSKFENPFEASQTFLDRVTRSRWFINRFREKASLGFVIKPLETNANVIRLSWSWESIAIRRTRYKTCLFPVLFMPTWELDELTILHVVAHALTSNEHTREWAKTFLRLTAHVLGRESATTLRENFRRHRVRWYPKRTLSSDELARLRARAKAVLVPFRERPEIEYGGGGA